MQPFPVPFTARAVPLRDSNVDTDAIIPSRYLKRITRTGYADGLFAAWRGPNFALDRPEHAGAAILVAGPDFGTGSSREHAVWALQDAGLRVVLSSRFADIFRGNAAKGGLLAVELAQDDIDALWTAVDADPATAVTVDLPAREVRWDAGARALRARFELDDYTAWRLLEGLDDIALTLRHEDAIAAFEARRPGWLPTAAASGRPV